MDPEYNTVSLDFFYRKLVNIKEVQEELILELGA
jgi:hypothetical protein